MSTTRQDLSTVSQGDSITVRPSAEGERFGRRAPRSLHDLLSLEDFEEPARRYLPRPIFGYISGGVETQRVAARQSRRLRASTTSCRACWSTPAPATRRRRCSGAPTTCRSASRRWAARRSPPTRATSCSRKVAAELNTVDDPERRIAHARWRSVQAKSGRPPGSRPTCRATRRSSRRSSSARSARASTRSCSRWTCRCRRTARTTCATATARRSSRRRGSRGTA